MVQPPASSQVKTSLSTLAIRRHIASLVLTVAVIVLGLFAIQQIPVDLLPSITYPRIGVRADAPGVSPEVAVDEVTRPLEEALSATEGVVQVVSQTREGRIQLDLYFQPGGNIDQALNDATATLNRSRNRLPDTIGQPRLFKFDPSQLPVYETALTSPSLRGVELRVFAEQELSRELTTVPGVASVDVSGGVQEEIQVNLDPARLQALGLGVTDVLNALSERNLDTSGGRLQGPTSEPLTRVAGRFQNVDEIRNLIFDVGSTDGDASSTASPASAQQVYLRDFAEVIDGTEDQRIFVALNGEPAVKVSIQKQPVANTVEVVNGIKQRIAELKASGLIPADLVMNTTLDESVFIQNSIRNVAVSGLIGAILAGLAVLLFLGSLRQTFIIVLAIPLAALVSILLMGLFGLSLNVFSLGGLALGVGIVVDNAIVMLENIVKGVQGDSVQTNGMQSDGLRMNGAQGNGAQVTSTSRSNKSVIRQAEKSSQELESALFASTTTNLVAVLPFLLIGGFISLLFNELVLTVSFAVGASLIVALTVVPAFASRLLSVRGTSGVNKLWLIRWFDQRLQGLTQQYARTLKWVLQKRILVLAAAFCLFGGSSVLMVGHIPQEILPSISTGQANLFVQFPPGTTAAENQQVMTAVDDLLMQQPEVEYVFTTSGGFLFGSSTSENALRGSSKLTLVPGTDVAAFSDRMNREFSQFNLVKTRLRISPGRVRGLILNNSPVRSDVDVILQGSDTAALEAAGAQVISALDEQATLARYSPDADPQQPEIQIRPDWERAADLGLSAQAIGQTVQTVLSGAVPTQLQRGDRLIDVRVQTPDTLIQNPAELAQLPLFAQNNRQAGESRDQPVRLGDIARIEEGKAPGEIQRISQRQVFIIEGRLSEGANLGAALEEVDRIFETVSLPAGITRLPSFSAQSNAAITSGLGLLGGLATFLVFTVMAVQYNSLIDPLVIMLTVPLALAGGILGLFITQTAIGATVIVGTVLLVGIVVNNAIILVELANQIYKKEKCTRAFAILKAAPQRLRPILMTTITTVLGMFPLALGIGEGSEFLQPLGVVVFSGLSLATLLTLFIIPCFYTLLHSSTVSQ
ncbi:MAG: efflux RND transporter permease subunit [Cyanobacteria bacterium P01_D01_bin.36]